MKKLILLLIVSILAIGIVLAQEKKKETKEFPKDTILMISLPALDKQEAELKEELQKQMKERDDAKAFLEVKDKNILSIQATLNAIAAIKQDPSLKAKK